MMATTADVARVARMASEDGDRGSNVIYIHHHLFNLRAHGWCTRFVRQCHEAALGLPYVSPEEHDRGVPYPWEYAAGNARQLEAFLPRDGLPLSSSDGTSFVMHVMQPAPGDIICFNRYAGPAGHVGIFLGDNEFAENTASTIRGPGTTISHLSDFGAKVQGLRKSMADRLTGYYRAVPLRQSSDVDDWAAADVAWAKQQGLLTGDPFRGRDPVTRQELAVVLHRLKGGE